MRDGYPIFGKHWGKPARWKIHRRSENRSRRGPHRCFPYRKEYRMQKTMVKSAAAGTLLGGSLLFTGLGVASAAPVTNIADGLVSVQTGNITVAKDVNVDVAAQVAANVCGVNVSDVNVLAEQVDASGAPVTVCTANNEPVTIANA
jgi:hypothetical protein